MSSFKSAWLLAVCLLAGCQHKPVLESDATSTWQNDRAYFNNRITNKSNPQWRYSAKVGITTDKIREQANLVWQFRDQSNNVRLFGPLGAGAIKIEFDPYGVRLSDSKGELYSGASAEDLLEQITGWLIPVDSLSHWLFARPAPDKAFRYQLNAQGNVAVMEQAGWAIRYDDYREYGADGQLPRKLLASKLGVGSVSVKLITKSWQF